MQLHFHHFGHGPPLVLLHGLFGSLTNWLGVSRRLAEHFTLFALDQRNHGRSAHSSEMSYPAMAADVGEFLNAQGLTSAHVLGHSMGGKVAMQFALNHPAQVRRLVVVDIAPGIAPPQHAAVFAALRALDLAAARSREELFDALAERLPDAAVRRFLLKNVVPDANGAFRWQLNLSGIHASYQRLTEAVSGGRQFAKPTLFLRGERSNYITETSQRDIARWFPNATGRTLPGAGHWVHADAPLEFARAVIEFLLTQDRE